MVTGMLTGGLWDMATTVVTKQDSDGTVYEICEQSLINSCGPASMFMAACIRRSESMGGGEDKILEISSRYSGRVEQDGPGADLSNIATTMGVLGIRATKIMNGDSTPGATPVDPGMCYKGHPALVLVGWYAGADRTGGHWVVATGLTKDATKMIFLDSWRG